MGGKGIALIILTFFLINFFSFIKSMVEMKLITFWLDLKFNLGIIFTPTAGVTARKIQLHLSTIS